MALGVGRVSGRVGAFGRLLTSDKALLVASSVLISAVAVGFLGPYVQRLPFVGSHPFIFYLVVAFVVFFLASMTSGKIMYLLQGIALGTAVQGLLTFPAVQAAQAQILARANR